MGSKTVMRKMSIAAEAAVHARIANQVKCYIYNITYAYNIFHSQNYKLYGVTREMFLLQRMAIGYSGQAGPDALTL